MDSRIERIRESERKSHIEVYTSEELYNSDSWLRKPIKTIRDLVPDLKDRDSFRALDLGCGVGRNSIFLAEQFKGKECRIDCVDILGLAIEKLNENAVKNGICSSIFGVVDTIEHYEIKENTYDLIMAVSSLEHVESEEAFCKKLTEIKDGIKENGIVCLVINSNVREMDRDTSEEMEPQFEVNLPTEVIQSYLDEVFSNCHVIKKNIAAQEYDIPRDMGTSRLSTDVITYLGQMKK